MPLTQESTDSPTPTPENIDLLRRYCPGLAVHTHTALAAYIVPDARGCWRWPKGHTKAGYGFAWCPPTPYGLIQTVTTHRYMYETLVGPIPDAYDVHHRCEVKDCWYPLHLEAVTPTEHKARHRRGIVPDPWHPPVQLRLGFAV